MDKQIIEKKLESLRHCIQRIEQKRPESYTELADNLDLQDILSVNLERAVQLCVDIASHIISSMDEKIPDTMAKAFIVLRNHNILSQSTADVMTKAVGFRNIAVHNYQTINWEIVFNISTRQIDNFRRFSKEINDAILTD